MNFIYLLNLLFILLIQYLNFSDQSTCNPEQEDSIWTQGGIQGLVDRSNQDQKAGDQVLDSLYQVPDCSVQDIS